MPDELHEKELFQKRAALGIQSVLRMIFDGSWQFCEAEIFTQSAPIWTLHSVYGSALLCLNLENAGGVEDKWLADLKEMKSMLKTLEPRWKLAGII
jgi:hypothetical protein